MAACSSQLMSAQRYIVGLCLWEGGLDVDAFERMAHLGLSVSRQSILNLRPALADFGQAAAADIVSKDFYVVGDNLDITFGRRDLTSERKAILEHFFFSILFNTRVPIPVEMADTQQPQKDILECPVTDWLQSAADQLQLGSTFAVHVARVVSRTIPALANIAAYFPDTFDHIPHRYSQEMKVATTAVPLLLVLEGETSTAEMVHIVRDVMAKVDSLARIAGANISGRRIAFGGDQLTCERAGADCLACLLL